MELDMTDFDHPVKVWFGLAWPSQASWSSRCMDVGNNLSKTRKGFHLLILGILNNKWKEFTLTLGIILSLDDSQNI
jgi:hypothetical protein